MVVSPERVARWRGPRLRFSLIPVVLWYLLLEVLQGKHRQSVHSCVPPDSRCIGRWRGPLVPVAGYSADPASHTSPKGDHTKKSLPVLTQRGKLLASELGSLQLPYRTDLGNCRPRLQLEGVVKDQRRLGILPARPDRRAPGQRGEATFPHQKHCRDLDTVPDCVSAWGHSVANALTHQDGSKGPRSRRPALWKRIRNDGSPVVHADETGLKGGRTQRLQCGPFSTPDLRYLLRRGHQRQSRWWMIGEMGHRMFA